MKTSRLSTQGRVTLPPEVREALGIGPGDVLSYELDGDSVILSRGADTGVDGDDGITEAVIEAALRDQGPTMAAEDVFAALHARIEARAGRRNAA